MNNLVQHDECCHVLFSLSVESFPTYMLFIETD